MRRLSFMCSSFGGRAVFLCGSLLCGSRRRRGRSLGEGRLRRETVEGFPLFVGRRGPSRRRALPLRRDRPLFLRGLSFELVLDAAVAPVGLRHRLPVFLFG